MDDIESSEPDIQYAKTYGRRATSYVLCAVMVAGCATTPSYKDIVLARVNDEPITAQDLEDAFTQSHRGPGIFAGEGQLVRTGLDRVIDKQLLVQEARRIGLDQDAEIRQALDGLRGRRAAEAYYRDEVDHKVLISEEAIAAANERLGDHFRAWHILVGTREEAVEILGRVDGGEDFAEIANQVSRASTTAQGKHLGIVAWGRLDPQLEEKLWLLEAEQVSEPFETKEGWNLLYVTERVSRDPPELEKVRSGIRAILLQREEKRRADALFHKLMAQGNGVIHEAALAEVLKASDGEELSPTTVLAEAAGEQITLAQFQQRFDLGKVRQLPTPEAVRPMRRLLEDELFKILLKKEALALGYGERPEIRREIEKVRDKLAVDLLLNRVVFARLAVGNEAAETYYQANQQEFIEPEAVKVRLIVVDAEEEARAVMGELQDGQNFAELARKVSKDPASAEVGGEVGWIRKGQAGPNFEKVVFSLKAGEVGLVKMPVGYAVIRVDERKQARLKPFAEVREQARQKAFQQKSRQTLKQWVTRLREVSVIEIDDEAISRAVASYPRTLHPVPPRTH